jgi:predicted AAA+ superfamily ATPase
MKNVTESLAGRVAILNLQGLSQCEKMGKADSSPFLPSFELKQDAPILKLSEIYELIWRGSYPRLLSQKEMDWTLFYDSYIGTYIEKDVKTLINISQEHSFLKFLKVAAARNGQVLNYSEMAKDVEVSVNTIKAWMSILETSGLIYLLYPYSNNITTRAIKSPKLYFFDTGLVCYLTGWDTVKVLENGAMSGALLETYIVSDIIKSYHHNGQRPNIYYYRDRDQKEIDLIIEKNAVLHPIEIKRSANPNIKDIKNFAILKSFKRDIGLGALICLIDAPLALDKNTIAIPAAYL